MNSRIACEINESLDVTCTEAHAEQLDDVGVFHINFLGKKKDRRDDQHLEVKLRGSHVLNTYCSITDAGRMMVLSRLCKPRVETRRPSD